MSGSAEPLLFDIDLLDEDDPFEIDSQRAHLVKHEGRDLSDLYDLWESNPAFYPAKPPAHWMMVGIVRGDVLLVPLAAPNSGRPDKCRPIGLYKGSSRDAKFYRAFLRGEE